MAELSAAGPEQVDGFTLRDLERVVAERRRSASDSAGDQRPSYSRRLLSDDRLLRRKIIEEAVEFSMELEAGSQRDRAVAEAADLLYHVIVGLQSVGLELADIERELERRRAE